MSTATADIHAHDLPADTRTNYLNVDHSVKSWLLTKDHKRIALLYLISITLMFFVGGFFAVMMRIHLIEPQGYLVTPENYNKLFTMHGVIMVFFFLVPSIPATLGNFLVPKMCIRDSDSGRKSSVRSACGSGVSVGFTASEIAGPLGALRRRNRGVVPVARSGDSLSRNVGRCARV